jgi:flavin-dependent dehydrogenase
MKIVIVGGGTAGWMAGCMAANLNKLLKNDGTSKQYDVTVIESSNIPIIGAGEGSTGLLMEYITKKFKNLGVNEIDFLYETDSTLKLGIRFKDWDGVGTEYLSPIQPTFSSSYNVDIDLLSFIMHGHYADSSPAGYLMHNGLSSFYTTKNKTVGTHSYHFDAHKVGKYLKKIALQNSIKHIDAEITDVNINTITGECDSVRLKETNELVTADLWIDCSGFSRLLANKVGAGWISYKDNLPVNSALPYLHKYEKNEDIKLETLAWAQPNGWMWQIPTQERYGCGYVFCDYFTNADGALRELEKTTGRKIQPIRELKFDVGRLKEFWSKNVVSIGLSSGFLEPLQATSIHSSIVQCELLFNHCLYSEKQKTMNITSINRYNEFVGHMFDDFRDLLQIHYMSKRNDSDFWKFVKNELVKTEKTKYMMEVSKYRCPSMFDFDIYHGAAGWGVWCWTMVGLGYVDKNIAEQTLANSGMLKDSMNMFKTITTSNINKKYALLNSNDFMKALWDKKIK